MLMHSEQYDAFQLPYDIGHSPPYNATEMTLVECARVCMCVYVCVCLHTDPATFDTVCDPPIATIC
jgi:hypothetical protein